jgi:hypothetical protein
MYGTLIGGWGIPAIALTLAMVFSGVSFRFGGKYLGSRNALAALTGTQKRAISTIPTVSLTSGSLCLSLQA